MQGIIKNKISSEKNLKKEDGIIQRINGMFWKICDFIYLFMPNFYQKYAREHGTGHGINDFSLEAYWYSSIKLFYGTFLHVFIRKPQTKGIQIQT